MPAFQLRWRAKRFQLTAVTVKSHVTGPSPYSSIIDCTFTSPSDSCCPCCVASEADVARLTIASAPASLIYFWRSEFDHPITNSAKQPQLCTIDTLLLFIASRITLFPPCSMILILLSSITASYNSAKQPHCHIVSVVEPLLCAKSGEEEAQVRLEATEDGGTPIAEA